MTAYTSNPVTLTIVASAPPPPPPGGIPAWATDANLPAGSTKIISLNTLSDCWEGPQPAGSGNITKSVNGWTSGVDAPLLGVNGSKIWAGGGDADGWDTSAYAFHYATQMWSRIKNRTTALNWTPGADAALPATDPHRFDTVHCEHGDGTPAAPHSYDAYVYLPPDAGGGAKGALLRPVSRFMYTTNSTNWAHKLTLGATDAESAWSRASGDTCPLGGGVQAMSDYDPTTKRVFTLGYTFNGVWLTGVAYLDTATGLHGNLTFSGMSGVLIGGGSCMRFWRGIGNDKRYLIWFAHGKPQLFDLDALTKLWAPPMATPFPEFGEGHGLAWCAPLGCFFVKPTNYPANSGPLLYKITPPANPTTGTWAIETITLPGLTEVGNGIWKRLHYVDALRALTWFYSATGPVYAYRPLGV
jgi:hypothetical protein